VHVHSQFPNVQINDDNQAFWVTSKNLKYSLGSEEESKAEWWSLIWYGLAIPKQAFML